MGDPAEENDPPPESIARMKNLRSVVNPEVTNYRTILMEKRTVFIGVSPRHIPRCHPFIGGNDGKNCSGFALLGVLTPPVARLRPMLLRRGEHRLPNRV